MVPPHSSTIGRPPARSTALNNIRRRDTRLLARRDEFRGQLEDIHAKRKREFMKFRDRALDLIEEFKDNCYNLLREEEQCLEQLNSTDFGSLDTSTLHSVLKDCGKGVPERVKFVKKGLLVSFEPEPEPDTINSHTLPQSLFSPTSSVSPTSTNPSTTVQAISSDPSPPRQERKPLPASNATTCLPIPFEFTPPVPRDTGNTPSPPDQSTLNTGTKQNRKIKPSQVKKGKYWVFEHGSPKARRKMYILRCPNASCQQPVFSKHPFRQNRAHDHLKTCKVPFKNDADVVRRYAQLVVQERQSRPLTREWSKKHNATLIGTREDSLHEENTWPGIDEEADELS